MWGDNGREGEIRHWKGGHTIQQRQRRRGTMGNKTVGKADTPSNTGTQEGVQWETVGDRGQDPREGGHTIQQRQRRRRGAMGDKTLRKADTESNKRNQEGV